MEKCYRGVTRVPELFQRDLVTKEVGSPRRAPRLGGPLFFDDRVTLRAGRASFSTCNYLTHLTGLTRSRAETISACGNAVVRSWLVQRGQLFSQINACQS